MASDEVINQLFKSEATELKKAVSIMENDAYRNNELMAEYEQLVKAYNRLLNLTKKVFKISDSQAKDIKRRESELKNLLDNSNQGFLTFGSDFLVDREYSSECYQIFNQRITHFNVLDLLAPKNNEQKRIYQKCFEAVFALDDPDKKFAKLAKLPNIIKINNHFINIKYRFIERDEFEETQDQIMLILTDITEKRKVEDQVLFLSYHDKLTSLYNRAYVDSIIPQFQTPAQLPFSIIMADMNGLKLTNDVFGHESGDKLLTRAAQVFKACCRKNDVIARWGGDEFLILLPGTEASVCRRICDRIKEMCSQIDSDPIQLSFSLGSATVETINADVASMMTVAENVMYNNKLKESKNTRRQIIVAAEKILYSKCMEDEAHIGRMKQMAGRFAEILGIDPKSEEIVHLLLLVSLHDIGKVAIPGDILSKPGRLTPDEMHILRNCPKIGYRMAQSIDEPQLAQEILAIREHWDGQGYPDGLEGEEIPFFSRVVALIDAYDVMTHERPYRKKVTPTEAAREISRCGNCQFDPRLVEQFLFNLHYITAENASAEK